MINSITKLKLRNTQVRKKEYYLIGGGEYNDKLGKKIKTKILQKINNPSILIIPWTSKDANTLKKYRKIIFNFFKRLKVKKITFLEKSDSLREARKKFGEANILYLPGGETEILLKNIKSQKIINLLKNFNGVIVGVSAGAYVLTNGYIKKNKKILIIPALRLINVLIKAHYNAKMDKFLIPFSRGKKIYGIPDNCVLVFQKRKLCKIIGKVYLFNNGRKAILK